MNVQTITRDGKPEYVVLLWADYQALVEAAEEVLDTKLFSDIKQKLASGEEEMVPSRMVDDLLDGVHPVKAWREHRGMTQDILAAQAGISKAYLSQIETGKRTGAIKTLQALALTLGVTVDDLQE